MSVILVMILYLMRALILYLMRACCICPAAKRSAPIPVMVEEVDMDDGSFFGEISPSLIL